MSADKEIAEMLSEPGKTPTEKVLLNLDLAKKEILKVLQHLFSRHLIIHNC